MRRTPRERPENRLAWAEAEIERLKALTTRITDGRNSVPAEVPVAAAPVLVNASEHAVYGTKHTRSLAVTAAAGVSLNVSIEEGQVWINGVFFSVAAGSLLMVNATTNFVFVNSAGALAQNTTGFPTSSIPLATVVTAGGDITSVNDRRAYLNAGAWNSITGILTTRGDLLTRDATQLVRLGIGAAGSILRSDALDPAWTINPTIAGYMRVGDIAAPANVTAGDLTFIRAFVNDDSNFSLQVVAPNPRLLLDSGDFLEYNRASDLLDIQIGSAVEFRISASYYEQDIETVQPATPAAGFVRGFPFTTLGRDVPTWKDDGGFQYMAPEKMRAFVPRPMLPDSGGAGATFGGSTTTAAVGLVNIPAPVELTRLSYRVTVAGANADNVMRFAIYSEDGQQKFLDATHAVGTGTGEQTVTFAAVWLGPGNYYLFACMSFGTAPGPTFICWTTDDTVFVAGAGGTEPDLEGSLTIVGGAAPATFDPLAITTPFRDSTLYCRLDGAA